MNWDPFSELDDMQNLMSRIFNRTLSSGMVFGNLPATDIYEEEGRLKFETALPQFKEDEVDVQINGDRLEIKAEHKSENEHKDRNYLRRESQAASYYRQFVLPKDVDSDTADAKFDNGVLKVSFERKELPQPKKLSIGSGKEQK
jgi:HSP20 family protein